MRVVHGVQFEHQGEVVEQLLERIFAKIDQTLCYADGKQIRFALRPPNEPLKKNAYRIFIQIKSEDGLTRLRRPLPPKYGPEIIDLNESTLEDAVKLCFIWHGEVRGIKPPAEPWVNSQPQTLSGGQFESNRRKH